MKTRRKKLTYLFKTPLYAKNFDTIYRILSIGCVSDNEIENILYF
jgi:hypothetical protein